MCSGGVLENEWVKLQAVTKLSANSSGRASRIAFLQYPYWSTEVNRASSARPYRLGSLPKNPISWSLISALIGVRETRHFTCPQTDVFRTQAGFGLRAFVAVRSYLRLLVFGSTMKSARTHSERMEFGFFAAGNTRGTQCSDCVAHHLAFRILGATIQSG